MVKKIIQTLLRISLLLVIIVLGFTAIFPGWLDYRQIIIDSVTTKFMSNEDIVLLEEARQIGISFKQHKNNVLSLRRLARLKQEKIERLHASLTAGETDNFKSILTDFSKNDLPNKLIQKTISLNNIEAFIAVYDKQQPPCTLESQQIDHANASKNSYNRPLVTKFIFKAENPQFFIHWLKRQCNDLITKLDFIELLSKDLMQFGRYDLLRAIPNKESYSWLYQQVLWQTILNEDEQKALALINDGIGFDHNKAAFFSLPKTLDKNKKPIDAFYYAIKSKQLELASKIIEKDPQYIQRNELNEELYTLMTSSYTHLKALEFLSDGKLDLQSINIDLKQEFIAAVNKGHLKHIQLLLRSDTQLSFKNIHNIDWERLDFAMRNVGIETTKFFISRGLDVANFALHGLDQLKYAMLIGDIDAVEFLLDKIKVQPDRIYRGKSILNHQIGGNDSTKKHIKALLIKYGAHENIAKMYSKETGVTYNPSCRIGKKISKNIFNDDELVNPLQTEFTKNSKMNSYNVCEAALAYCFHKYGKSLDDCFETIQSCNTHENKLNGSNKVTVCCPSTSKKTYNDNRCAGLDIRGAAYSLKGLGFSETYSVPYLTTLNKEFQDSKKEQYKELEKELRRMQKKNE